MLKHDPSASKTYGKETVGGARRISQETFDEAVRENIEDLGMEPDEALAEAVQQFKLDGVDLSNIDKRLPARGGEAAAPKHIALQLIDRLGDHAAAAPGADAAHGLAVLETLGELAQVLTAEPEARTLVGHNGGIAVLVRQLRLYAEAPGVLAAALRTARCACVRNDENRERFNQFGEGPQLVADAARLHRANAAVLERALLAIAQTATRHEGVKDSYAAAGMLQLAAEVLREHSPAPGAASAAVVRAACSAVTALCTPDDPRQPASRAQQRARLFCDLTDKPGDAAVGGIPALAAAARAFASDARACVAVCAAVTALASLRDEICEAAHEAGLLAAVVSVLQDHGLRGEGGGSGAASAGGAAAAAASPAPTPVAASEEEAEEGGSSAGKAGAPEDTAERAAAVARSAMAALAALALNDRNKCVVCEGEALPLLLRALALHGTRDAGVAEQALAVLAAVSLRHPANVDIAVDQGAVGAIVRAMRTHAAAVRVQKQGCLALRNMAVRNEALRPRILAEGAEEAIRAAKAKHGPAVADLAFAALRDLGLEYRV